MYCNLCTRCIFNKNVVCMYEVNYLKSALNVVAIVAGWMLLLPLPLSLLLCILLLFLSTHIIHSLKLLVADVFSVSAFFFFFFTSLCSARCALYSVYKTIISNCGVHSRTLSEPWARFTVRHRHPWSFFFLHYCCFFVIIAVCIKYERNFLFCGKSCESLSLACCLRVWFSAS